MRRIGPRLLVPFRVHHVNPEDFLRRRFVDTNGEVAAITLDDIDWRAGLLLVHGKGGHEDALPLPTDVGEAIVSYLRRRPRCGCRALFLRVTAPRQGLSRVPFHLEQ